MLFFLENYKKIIGHQCVIITFSFFVFFCVILSLVFSFRVPFTNNTLIPSYNPYFNINFLTKINNTYVSYIRNAIKQIFRLYFSNCKNSDYFQPISGSCINGSQLYLTSIESLDTLFLANLTTEFKIAVDWIIKKFKISNNRWISLEDLCSRVIGSFISTYTLTGKTFFLQKAMDLGYLILNSFSGPIPYLFIDASTGQGKNSIALPYSTLSESSSFLLEFTSLSLLSNDDQYYNKVRQYLECVDLFITSDNIPAFWSTTKCKSIRSNHDGISSFTIKFLCNIIKLNYLYPTFTSQKLMDKIISYIHYHEADLMKMNDYNIICPLKNALKHYNSHINISIIDRICKEKISINYFDQTNDKNLKSNFDQFSYIFLEDSINSDQYEFLLEKYSCGYGGICRPYFDDNLYFDDFQPSSVLGILMKFLYFNATKFIIPKNIVVNAAGHFVPS